MPTAPAEVAMRAAATDRRSSSAEIADMRDIAARHPARRALEAAAAGNLGILMVGWPGAGMAMLARRLPGILPMPNLDDTREITRIYSVSGILDGGCVAQRPFRAPHHTVSETGLIGGGQPFRPGEITLAHKGILYLDEAAEFHGKALDAAAIVLRAGSVQVHRNLAPPLPAAPLLVASIPPCPCGTPRCDCRGARATAHRARLGTLLPFMPIRIRVQAQNGPPGDDTETMRKRVTAAREFAAKRAKGQRALEGSDWKPPKGYRTGSLVDVARVLADLDQSETVRPHHGDEAWTLTQESTPAPQQHRANP